MQVGGGCCEHPSNFLGAYVLKGSRLADDGVRLRWLQSIADAVPLSDCNHMGACSPSIKLSINSSLASTNMVIMTALHFIYQGQLLTEDYYVVNKFVKGYLGTANIDTNSRLCMSSAVAVLSVVFGEDIMPQVMKILNMQI